MQLEAIRLSYFRNYQDVSLSFPEGITILAGENAQGKTCLLYTSFSTLLMCFYTKLLVSRVKNADCSTFGFIISDNFSHCTINFYKQGCFSIYPPPMTRPSW